MSNDKFQEFQKFILKVEGTGYTNDPSDRGGPTKFGGNYAL